ncbi:MAG TPA: hypothetical protein VIE67_08040 [Rudaea sp.]|jgi:hypothetical protein|uniref:hypothetical protein n=1 Tax=Rudaea sp. TaxID=2136325 RepID=UPI002F943B98
MKTEQVAFAERLAAAMKKEGIEPSPVELERLLARHGGVPVTPQAISGWLGGKHMPKQANMRALAKMVGLEPYVLQYGNKVAQEVGELRATWPTGVGAVDRLAIEEFLSLPSLQRKLVRDLIQTLATPEGRRKKI